MKYTDEQVNCGYGRVLSALAAADTMRPVAQPIKGDVIQAMAKAGHAAVDYRSWDVLSAGERKIYINSTTAAATVLLDAVHAAILDEAGLGDKSNNQLADRVRARILAPKKKPINVVSDVMTRFETSTASREEVSRAVIEALDKEGMLQREQEAKLVADRDALLGACKNFVGAVDVDHIIAVEKGRVSLSGDAVRDLFLALDSATAAIAAAEKEDDNA
jgi:hypothetical protein